MYKSKDVVFDNKTHWILKTSDYYELYEKRCTHSIKVGVVSLKLGLDEAIKTLNVLHMRKD